MQTGCEGWHTYAGDKHAGISCADRLRMTAYMCRPALQDALTHGVTMCVQAKQEDEQQKAAEEVKRRQEAIRRREEEATQRRYTACVCIAPNA